MVREQEQYGKGIVTYCIEGAETWYMDGNIVLREKEHFSQGIIALY